MRRILPLAALLLAGTAALAGAAGPWSTLVRPYRYTRLLAHGDTVWCATLESGLLTYVRSTDRFESATREPNGLASNRVTTLALDRSGRLWVGTQGAGVSRLEPDRSSWRLLNAFDGIPSDSITALRAQGDTLWIGTLRGLALWDGDEIAGTLPDGVNPSPFASNLIRGVVQIGDTVWVATDSTIYASRLSAGLADWQQVSAGLGGLGITGLAWDGRSLITISGSNPYLFDFGTGQWLPRGGPNYVQRISDDQGAILAVSRTGIWRWTGTSWTLLPGAPTSPTICAEGNDRDCPSLYAATMDEEGRYAAANQNGLRLKDPATADWPTHLPPAPPGNNIVNLVLDGDQIYVAAFEAGLGRYRAGEWQLWPPGDCTFCDTTFTGTTYTFGLMRDRQGRIWAGSWGSAIESYDGRSDPPSAVHFWWRQPGTDSHTWAWSSTADSAGGRWFGMDTPSLGELAAIGIEYYDSSATGAYVRNYNSSNSAVVNDKIHGFTADALGTIWVGYSPGGIDHFPRPQAPDYTLNLTRVFGSDNLDVQGLVARGDDIWALTTGEVLRLKRLDPRISTADIYPIPAGTSQFANQPLAVGPDGRVWAGTVAGLRAYRSASDFTDYTTLNSPLVNDEVRAVRVDPVSGVVWIGTAGGISRFDPSWSPPAPPPVASLIVRVTPNPALLTGAGTQLRLRGNSATWQGTVHDAAGRRLRSFSAANGQVFWDGRDDAGVLVHPGLYFVRVEAGGHATTVRAVLLR